ELAFSCAELSKVIDKEENWSTARMRARALVDGDFAESLRFIQSAVLRLAAIIDALLRLSRAGRVEYRTQLLNLDHILARIRDALADSLNRRGATIALAPLPPIHGDAVAIEQLFANLIDNAINYLDPQRCGLVEVGVDEKNTTEAMQVYFVRDNGL